MCASTAEYVEVATLHGYHTMLWSENARIALEAEHDRLVAQVTAREIVDDILDWMLEGWCFGERKSEFVVAGYVPSMKKTGFVRVGQEQVAATAKVRVSHVPPL